MVGAIKLYSKDPMKGKHRGRGLYYYRGKVKALGGDYWSKWSEDRDVKKKNIAFHKGVFQLRFAHKGDVMHTAKGNK